MNYHSKTAVADSPFHDVQGEDAIWQRLVDITSERYGITTILYAFTHSRFTSLRTGITNSLFLRYNYPQDYLDSFPNGLSVDEDIAAELILKGESAFLWESFESLPLRPEQRARYELDKSLGMGTGASFGFRFGGNSGFGGMCWGKRYEDPARFRALWQDKQMEMRRLAQQFDQAMRPAMVVARFQLTPRERDVMSFSAGGMTAKQIAEHLGLSPKTIHHALERSRKKLEAVSTMEAVAKALVYELIG